MCDSALLSLRKTVGKVSPILVTLTSRRDPDFEISNVSLKENKPDGVNPNSNDIDYYVRKNEWKILWFSADCTEIFPTFFRFRYLKDLVPVFNRTCDLLLEKLRQLADGKTEVKMYDQFSKSTLNIIANVSNVGLLM